MYGEYKNHDFADHFGAALIGLGVTLFLFAAAMGAAIDASDALDAVKELEHKLELHEARAKCGVSDDVR